MFGTSYQGEEHMKIAMLAARAITTLQNKSYCFHNPQKSLKYITKHAHASHKRKSSTQLIMLLQISPTRTETGYYLFFCLLL